MSLREGSVAQNLFHGSFPVASVSHEEWDMAMSLKYDIAHTVDKCFIDGTNMTWPEQIVLDASVLSREKHRQGE